MEFSFTDFREIRINIYANNCRICVSLPQNTTSLYGIRAKGRKGIYIHAAMSEILNGTPETLLRLGNRLRFQLQPVLQIGGNGQRRVEIDARRNF